MSDSDIGQNIGTGIAIFWAFLTWWRVYGPRWKPVTNGSKSLSTAVAELEKCEEDREELRELVVAAVQKELGERDAPNPQGSG